MCPLQDVCTYTAKLLMLFSEWMYACSEIMHSIFGPVDETMRSQERFTASPMVVR